MKIHSLPPLLSAVLLSVSLAACTPAAAPGALPVGTTEIPTLALATGTATGPAPLETAVLPVATSRGPELHATDPATVSLASGGLHFVEFFRFT